MWRFLYCLAFHRRHHRVTERIAETTYAKCGKCGEAWAMDRFSEPTYLSRAALLAAFQKS
jgi:hypothetical protein